MRFRLALGSILFLAACGADAPPASLVSTAPVAPGADRLTLFQTAAQGLRERAEDRPLVVGIDDALLLDDGSAALAHHLAATGTAFVVLTVRTGETVPEPVTAA